MKRKMRRLFAAIIAFFPTNCLRICLYRNLLRYDIDYNCKIGLFNFILCDNVRMTSARIGILNFINSRCLILGKDSWINSFNKVKLMYQIEMGTNSGIKNRNLVIGLYRADFSDKNKCVLKVGDNSLITNQHIVDCTSTVTIGDNVVVAGNGTQIWSHGFDHKRKMIIKPIAIGNNVYIGSRCTIVGGVSICDNTTIAAATVVSRKIEEPGFYVSSSLILKK